MIMALGVDNAYVYVRGGDNPKTDWAACLRSPWYPEDLATVHDGTSQPSRNGGPKTAPTNGSWSRAMRWAALPISFLEGCNHGKLTAFNRRREGAGTLEI
jgi:hypothetical protein